MIMALLHVNFFARTLGMGMSMDVILPEGDQGIGVNGIPQWNDGRSDQLLWDGSSALPTLYLLHGTSDDSTIWQRRTAIERYVSDKKLAVVMPNVHLSAYCDQKFGYKYFTFLSQEVPEFCQRYFHCSAKPEENFIAGLSMGGYGALVHGLSQSQRFAAIGSFSGAAKVCDDREFQFSPAKLAEACAREDRKKPMYIACGDQDFLYQDNIAFKDYLEKLGFDVTWVVGEGYTHEWRFWNREVEAFLDWIPRTDAYYNGGEKRKI